MRKVDPWFLNDSAFLEWYAKSKKARSQLIEAVIDRKESPNSCFKGRIWGDFKRDVLMRGADQWKCMYCEGSFDAGSYSDAEHYRPKGIVTNERKDEDHPGYWWLAYEWQNLLLSCKYCNSSHPNPTEASGSHPGKLNEFPVSGLRIKSPGFDSSTWRQIDRDALLKELESEKPHLLHPYFDSPEEHFRAGKHGIIEGITDRGKKTIEICDLNRPRLAAARERAEKAAIVRLSECSLEYSKRGQMADAWFGNEEEYSMYMNSWLLNFVRLFESMRRTSGSGRTENSGGEPVV